MNMKRWRLLKTIDSNGAMQMAIDEAILTHRIRNEVPDTLRFFTWRPSCLTIGYFQDLNKEVAVESARALGVDVVRRYTGGGAVFHDKELTYSVAMSESEAPQEIIASYRMICGAIMAGLRTIGITSSFAPINDIVVNGKKISGNAQTRKEGVILQHGTVLIDVDVKKMFSLLKVPDEKIKDKMILAVEERLTSLKKELGSDAPLRELETAIRRGFEETFGVVFDESELTREELRLAEKLYREKYATKEWRELR